MLLKLYSIWDKKVQVFSAPFAFHNDEHAKRSLTMELRKSNVPMAEFPEDYQLYFLSDFSDHDAGFKAATPPLLVCEVSELAGVEAS